MITQVCVNYHVHRHRPSTIVNNVKVRKRTTSICSASQIININLYHLIQTNDIPICLQLKVK